MDIQIFKGILSQNQETLIRGYCTQKVYGKTAAIILKGSQNRWLGIVIKGAAAMDLTPEHKLRFEVGETFGEIAFLDDGKRTAKVYACEEDTEIAFLSWDKLQEISKKNAKIHALIMVNLAIMLAKRLRASDIVIAEQISKAATEKNTGLINKLTTALRGK